MFLYKVKCTSMKKLLLFMLIFGLAAFAGFSQQDEWYQGKIIKDVTFSGLVNVSVKELNAITDKYKGKVFTDEIFGELQSKLYGLNYFENMIPSVERAGRQDSDGIIIRFTLTEYPKITGLNFEGGSFLSKDRLLSFAEENGYKKDSVYNFDWASISRKIENAYINRSFNDVKVEYTKNPAPNNTYTVTYRIHEGYQDVIEAVYFEGNRAIPDEELKQCLIKQSRGVFNTGLSRIIDCNEDTTAITRYYGDRGYEISIDKIPKITESRIEGNMRFLNLTYIITREGEQYLFGGLEFSGNNAFSNAQLSALVQSQTGRVYNRSVIENDFSRIENLYSDAGYIELKADIEEIRKDRVISYKLKIAEGDKIYLADIIIKGNIKTSAEAIREKIPLKSGDVFSRKKVHDGIRNLEAMGVFANVEVDTGPGNKKSWKTLIITVTEK